MSGKEGVNSAEKAYSVLKFRILNLEYKPGRGLSTASLAEELAMSRSPIRDALLRLALDNLVETYPKSGSRVSLIDLDKVTSERFLRTSLETAAASEFAFNNTPEHLNEMRALIENQIDSWHKGAYVDFLHFDDLFHQVIFDTLGMRDCWEIIQAHSPNDHRIRLLSTISVEGTKNVVINSHKALVDAAERKSREDVMRIENQHLSRVVEETAKLVISFPDIFKSTSVNSEKVTNLSNIRKIYSGNEHFLNSLVTKFDSSNS
ncbi:MAG: GntR family transcriptional regulator [Sphaerochaeta sp.]|nr:GntR family transcriptional regulator [Sphaerochaeta sp.]